MSEYRTELGSLTHYRKGGVQVIEDDPKNYVFSNLFEVASRSRPFERVAVAKNFQYVIEAARAEGTSPWFTAAHDEFALCMDGRVEIQLVRLNDAPVIDPDAEGAIRLEREPDGRKMGRIVLGLGHMALLPTGAAYRLRSETPSVVLFQTLHGGLTLERWAQICQTA